MDKQRKSGTLNEPVLPSSMIYQYLPKVLDHLSVGIAVFDACDIRLLEANPLFLSIIDAYIDPSLRDGCVVGLPLEDWGNYEQLSGVVDIFRQVKETGIPYRGTEFAFFAFGRGISYWNWTLDAVKDADGHICYILLTASDVTDQVEARQQIEMEQVALRQAKKRVEAEHHIMEIIDTIARGVHSSLDIEYIGTTAIAAIHTFFHPTNTCLYIADASQQALRLLCVHASSDSRYVPDKSRFIPYSSSALIARASRQKELIVYEDLRIAVASGEIDKGSPLVSAEVRGTVCVPLWSGDAFEGAIAMVFAESIQKDGPEVRALIGCGLHIAAALARARWYNVIQHEQVRLQAVFDQLPEGILLVEVATSAISYANEAAANLLGVSTEELIGVPLHQHRRFLYNDKTDMGSNPLFPWSFAVVRALSGETVRSMETLATRPDGSISVILTSSAPLYGENHIITGAVVVFQDVTAQKSLEQQKNEFLSMANHELRTPITIVQGYSELLRIVEEQVPYIDPVIKRALANITEQCEVLTHLIEETLDLSRIGHGQFILKRAPDNLLQTLAQVIDSLSPTTRTHQIQLVVQGLQPTDTLIGNFDRRRMVQVMSNLISNAIKYSPNGKEIEVGVRYEQERPGQVLIWVKDYGIGITNSELSHIFKRFYRANTLDPSISGFGIGLFLVKEIVACHGGHVWAESKPGKGSTFYVLLPLK